MSAGIQVLPSLPYVDVLSYAASGATDYLAAVNAAIAANPNGTLFFAAGVNFNLSAAPNWGSFTGRCITAGATFSGAGAASVVPYYSDKRTWKVTNFPADNTVQAVAFLTDFLMGCNTIQLSVSDYNGGDSADLSPHADTLGVHGFNARVGGGVSGSTCTLHYTATGT